MARVKANLFEGDELVTTVTVERDDVYEVNGYFQTDDGGLYLIAEVREAGTWAMSS